MSANPKHRSTTDRAILLWAILLTPVLGLGVYMTATHHGVDDVTSCKLTAGVVAAWWMAIYVFIRVVKWRNRGGPSSLSPA